MNQMNKKLDELNGKTTPSEQKSGLSAWLGFLQTGDQGPGEFAGQYSTTDRLITGLAILIIGIFYLATIRTGHDWGDDFSLYIRHAINLATGQSYAANSYIHITPYVGPDAYPPIFPILLVPVYKLFGLNLTAMKLEMIVLFLLSLFLFVQCIKNDLPARIIPVLILIIGFNCYYWNLKDNIISEVPFMVFLFLSIFLVRRNYQTNPAGFNRVISAVLIAVSFYLCYGTRSIGLVLIPGFILFDLLREKRPTLFAAGTVGMTIFLIALQSFLLRSDRGYYDQFHVESEGFLINWMKFIWMNLSSYSTLLTEVWDNGYLKLPRVALTTVITLLAIGGFFIKVRKGITIIEIIMVLFVIVLIITPVGANIRYLIPIVPFYMYHAALQIHSLSVYKKLQLISSVVIIAAILFSYAAKYTKQDFREIKDGISQPETTQFFDYVKRQMSDNDVIIFVKPRALALFTGKKTSFYPVLSDDKDIWGYFQKIKATHLVVGPSDTEPYDREFLSKFVSKYQSNFEVVYSNTEYNVYKLVGTPQPYGRIVFKHLRFTDPLPKN